MKINKKTIFKYLLQFLIMLILSQARIFSTNPFLVASLFGFMWTGFNIIVISLGYFFCSLIFEISLQNLYVTLTVLTVMLTCYFVHKKLKKPLNVALVSIYLLISQICFLYYALNDLSVAKIACYLILMLISLYLFVLVFQLSILRGVFYKLTLTEAISFIYFIATLGLGLSSVHILNISVFKIIAVSAIILLLLLKKEKEAMFVSIAFSTGYLIGEIDTIMFANIMLLYLAGNYFRYPHKYKMAVTIIIVDVFFSMCFYENIHALGYNLLATIIAIILACAFPEKIIKQIQDKIYVCESEMSMRNIVNMTRSSLHKKFTELSNVFNEMKAIHLNLIKSDLSHDQVVNMLTKELMNGMCKDCLNKQKCFKGFGSDELSQVSKLVDIALKKGKVSLLDIPSSMAMKCNMVNLLIGKTNQIVSQYSQFLSVKRDVNNVKVLLAEQLGAVGQIMLDLGQEIDKHISFDAHVESGILSELLNENIICSEILIYNQQEQEPSVNLIVKGENAYNPKIEKIISKRLKQKMKVVKVEPIEINGYYSVFLERENDYEIVFGLSSYTKTGSSESGDTHSLLRLGKNRYLLALCDGMGSGHEANKTSALTIGLIEDFYKAGFNDELIISSVNKLLAINNQECFATLDLCLVDLNKEMIDFIKVGAPYSYIKRETSIEKIEGGALPVGVLENIQPSIIKSSIDTHSLIIMATDGVLDAFGESDDFEDFLKGIVSTNPQVVAQTILDEALSRGGNISKDDMTILVVRTYRKNTSKS